MKAFVAGLAVLVLALATGPARAQTAGAEEQRLAQEIFEAQGGLNNVNEVMRQMTGVMLQQLRASNPDGSEDQLQLMSGILSEEMQQLLPSLIRASTDVYARNFTAAQLKDMLAFYRTDTGRALSAKLPVLARESVQATSVLMPPFQYRVLSRYCAKIACSDEQKHQIEALKGAAGR